MTTESRPVNSREVARRVLDRIAGDGAWATPALDGELARVGLDDRDRRLASELVYGVLRHRARIDRAISAHAEIDRTPPMIVTILRVAAYQILMLDRVPGYAAVDDAVDAANVVGAKLGGFVNAVLRKLTANGEAPFPAVANDSMDAHLARFLGREKQGPSDERVHVGGRSVPVWWAVASVGSGHVERDDVLRAWKALPAAKALAAWKEIATGEAYDVLDAHATSMKDAGISGKPYMKDYRTRVAGLLADVSVALDAEGEKAAKAITKKLPSWGGGAQILIGLLSAARHAKARGKTIDPAFDATFQRLWERVGPDSFYAPAVEAEIEGALPPPRAKAFRAGLTRPT